MSNPLPPQLDLLDTTAEPYCCPGESYPISRSVHLARLASFYSPCRECPHRHETGSLGRRQVEQLDQVHRRGARRSPFDAEGVQGAYLNEVSTADAQRIAAAFGVWINDQLPATLPRSVILAHDGGDLTPEIVARSSEGLRYAGCDVVDVGVASSPAVMFVQARLSSTAAMLISQLTSPRDTIRMRFWGPGGAPLSQPGSLEQLEQIARRAAARRTRHFGGLSRSDLIAEYPSSLADYYHGLRPLRFVLDCDCPPLAADLSRLLKTVECEIVPATRTGAGRASIDLGPQVSATKSHFGVAIRESGEQLCVWDESGARISNDSVLAILAQHLVDPAELEAAQRKQVVVESGTSQAVLERLRSLGLRCTVASAGRGAMHEKITAANALMGGGPSGRFWLRPDDSSIMPDALHALSLLLVIFSQSDRAVSQVLAAGLATDRTSR